MEFLEKLSLAGLVPVIAINDAEDAVPLCKALAGRCVLADGKTTANINALRIEKQYEGQGHISKLMKAAEEYAASLGYKYLTIGVTSTHTRTKAIYQHFGYTHLLFNELDEGDIVEYYRKEI